MPDWFYWIAIKARIAQLFGSRLNRLLAMLMENVVKYEVNSHLLADPKDLQRRLERLASDAKSISGLVHKGRAAESASVNFITPADAIPPDSSSVRREIRMRRWRDSLFPESLFADPAWDLLLDLYAAHLEGALIPVTSACIAAAVPQTTALRWIIKLEQLGLIMRSEDDRDHRRRDLRLSNRAVETMNHWATSVFSTALQPGQGRYNSEGLALERCGS